MIIQQTEAGSTDQTPDGWLHFPCPLLPDALDLTIGLRLPQDLGGVSLGVGRIYPVMSFLVLGGREAPWMFGPLPQPPERAGAWREP